MGGNCFHSDFLASSKVDCINWGWSAWLKAQAKAIPAGYVLVPKEPTPKMIDAGYESSYDAKGFEIPMIYKAMIEARESAND